MGSLERRERERDEKREMILEAALRLFLDVGFEKTTVRRIAAAVEYTPGALYSYFKDKDEILYALHKRGFDKLIAMQRAALIDVFDPLERLEIVGRTYIRFAFENPAYYHLMFVAKSTAKKIVERDCWDPGSNAFDLLRQTVAQVAEAQGREIDVDVVSFTCWSTVHGMVSLCLGDRCVMMEHLGLEKVVDGAFSYFINLVTEAGSPSTTS